MRISRDPRNTPRGPVLAIPFAAIPVALLSLHGVTVAAVSSPSPAARATATSPVARIAAEPRRRSRGPRARPRRRRPRPRLPLPACRRSPDCVSASATAGPWRRWVTGSPIRCWSRTAVRADRRRSRSPRPCPRACGSSQPAATVSPGPAASPGMRTFPRREGHLQPAGAGDPTGRPAVAAGRRRLRGPGGQPHADRLRRPSGPAARRSGRGLGPPGRYILGRRAAAPHPRAQLCRRRSRRARGGRARHRGRPAGSGGGVLAERRYGPQETEWVMVAV